MAGTLAVDRVKVAKPDHVPQELVIDFDYYAPPGYQEDMQLAWKRLQNGPDIVWTPQNGGHWIFTRAEDIRAVQTDHEHFSMRSIVVPFSATNFKPINLDPPEHSPYRRLIMPHFMPKQVDRLEQVARDTAIELIEGFKNRGHCDFAEEFGRVLPVVVFLGLLDLPIEDRLRIQPYADMAPRGTAEERAEAHRQMTLYLEDKLAERRANLGDDLLSFIIKSQVNDAPITHDDLLNVCKLVLFGGLDTVASMLSFIARFLAMHPEHRRQLVERLDDTAFVRHAVEELIRRHGLTNTSRVVTMDFAYKGIQLRKDDMVQIPNSLVGLDDRINADPLAVDFSRSFPIQHAAFGNGPHTCPGAVLARREIQVFLEEWLRRIPDFELAGEPVMAAGMVNSIDALPMRWPVGG